jgi:cell division protein FtsN
MAFRKRKPKAGRSAGDRGSAVDSYLSFFSGLGIGLLAAFAVFAYQYLLPAMRTREEPPPRPTVKAVEKSAPGTEERNGQTKVPRFDFYQILPNREVNLSEWQDPEPEGEPAPGPAMDLLTILQVGSFKTFEAADQVRAELALLGIAADIQRVVISDQDTRHRVRIGPYTDAAKLEDVRRRLLASGMDFMVLKLRPDEAAGGG